jgi:CBS domain-containing protein
MAAKTLRWHGFSSFGIRMPLIESFIQRRVVILNKRAPAQSAAKAMCDRKIGCVVVLDDREAVVGILTDRDIVCGLFAYSTDAKTPVADIMTPNPVTIPRNADLSQALWLMETNGIRRVPVVQATAENPRKCVGILTLDDLLASQAVGPEATARIIQAQVFRSKNPLYREFRGFQGQLRLQSGTDAALDRFFSVIARRASVPIDDTVLVATIILGLLIQKMHYTGAAHLIASLPEAFQEELLDLPAGPNEAITVTSVVGELERQMGYHQPKARSVLAGFGAAMHDWLGLEQFDTVKAQLTTEFRLALSESLVPREPQAA